MGRQLDKFEQLVKDSEFSAFVLANPALDSFLMVSEVPTGEHEAALTERDMIFAGIIGVTNGWPRTALSVPLDPQAIHAISKAYIQYIRDHFPSKVANGVDWLERLHALPDTRDN